MNFEVYTSSFFEKQFRKLARKYPSLKGDILQLINSLRANPNQGNSLGRDCYKIRLAIKSKSQGKSGGARVISCVKIIDGNVYLLSIYDKSEKSSLTDKELTRLLTMLEEDKS